MNKIAVVTGASSGIGRCTAKALRDMGCKVYDLSRRNIPIENVRHIKTDITIESDVLSAVNEIISAEGRIDILVNCAGFGISGAVEFTTTEEAKKQFEVNFFGAVTVTRAVLPHMRENGSGRIVNISSVAAVAHIPFQTYYSASKAAIESYTSCLDNEVKAYGVRATAVEPGDICTEFTSAREKSFAGDDVYGGRISRSVAGMEKDEQKGMSPEFAGRYIAKVALRKKVKPVCAIGVSYKILSVMCKSFPCSLRSLIVGMLYAK
jgi:short-subunit dehydrogenase